MCGGRRNLKSHAVEAAINHGVDSEFSSPSSAEYKRYHMFSSSEWLVEMSTCIASTIMLGIIAGIFFYMENKPLSAWGYTISLNALISISTTGCSAALMHGVSEFISQLKWLYFKKVPQRLERFESFDEASRGIWGSIKFLIMVNWNLATLGALITIFRLGLAPLTQQVLKIEQRFINTTDHNVVFGYAHKYHRGIESQLRNSGIGGIPQDPRMQAAIVQGLYGINSPATFSCPGACIWNDSYVSIGFKSECKNVTQDTLKSMRCPKSHKNIGGWNCSMTTPGGLDISTRYWGTDFATNYYMNASSFMTGAQMDLPPFFPEIVRFGIYRSTPNATTFESDNINITDCSVSLTAYQYAKARANGTAFSFDKTTELDFKGKNPWKTNGNYIDGWIYTDASEADGLPAFNISRPEFLALLRFFQSNTIVTEWISGNWDNKDLGLSAALSGDVDINERFDKMATSMTDYLRSGPNSILAKGARIEKELFVTIRWYYMLGPTAIVLMGVVFAALTIFINRRSRKVPLWKSSAIAVLACQHNGQSGLIQAKVKDIREAKEMAKKSFVQLE